MRNDPPCPLICAMYQCSLWNPSESAEQCKKYVMLIFFTDQLFMKRAAAASAAYHGNNLCPAGNPFQNYRTLLSNYKYIIRIAFIELTNIFMTLEKISFPTRLDYGEVLCHINSMIYIFRNQYGKDLISLISSNIHLIKCCYQME